jgi:hypothetical protein
MANKHGKARKKVMGKLTKVRAKTGKFVDWSKVDETVANPMDLWGLIKRVFGIAVGKKDGKEK